MLIVALFLHIYWGVIRPAPYAPYVTSNTPLITGVDPAGSLEVEYQTTEIGEKTNHGQAIAYCLIV